MGYKKYKNLSDVCKVFEFTIEKKNFVKEKNIKVNKYFMTDMTERYLSNKNFCSEGSICERIISPIIYEIAKESNIPIWSHITFNVDKKLNLSGEADYLVADEVVGGYDYETPVVCLGEAKKDDFVGGWGQVGAEMRAAQIANKNDKVSIYGLVTNGYEWEFGKLKNKNFTLNIKKGHAPEDFDNLFNSLNWLFSEARKNLDKIKNMGISPK